MDDLARVDEYWNPEEEVAIMREKRPNDFRQLSCRGLQRLKDDLRRGHGDARVVAVSCHWGVICEVLGVDGVENAEILVTEMDRVTGRDAAGGAPCSTGDPSVAVLMRSFMDAPDQNEKIIKT